MTLHIAMLSIHSSPLGRMGTRDTGGMSVVLQELAREVGGRGHRVDIFTRATRQDAGPVLEPFANVRVVFLRVDGAESAPKEALFDLADAFGDRIDAFRKASGIDYDVIHSNYWVSGAVGRRFAASVGTPHIMTYHTLGAAKMASRKGHSEDSRRIAEEALLAARCDGVIAPTGAERDRLVSRYDVRPEKIHIVPCGVNLQRFNPDRRIDPPPEMRPKKGGPVLLFVGRFDPMKGLRSLLAGVALLPTAPPVELVLIGGDGPGSADHGSILRVARDLGIADRVRVLGSVDHREMPGFYGAADAVVVASRYESFGLVALEALACGTPVASTPVGIAPRVIRNGVNGHLSADGKPESLAGAIGRTLRLARHRDPLRIRSTVSGFDWSRVAPLLLDAYRKVIGQTHLHETGKHREPAI